MTDNTFWIEQEQRRVSWEPVNPLKNSFTSETPNLISKALALAALELPVKQFISEGLETSDISKLGAGVKTLRRNMEDEDRHDIAFNRCKLALTNYDSSVDAEADNLVKAWKDCPGNLITKTAVLENGVFFVILPLYNLFGFHPLLETQRDVSKDERIHVATHRKCAQLLGAKPNSAMNDLRKATVAWLTDGMDAETDMVGQQNRWLKASDTLMTKGISGLIETRFASQTAFFETSNRHIPTY